MKQAPAVLGILAQIGQVVNKDSLIRFDHRSVVFLAVCFLGFWLCMLLKLHGSSLPMWNQFVSDGNDMEAGLVLGSPRWIRFDEWNVLTTYMLSQQALGFPAENETLGGGKVPLLMNLPVKNALAFVRPQYWGLHLFDVERGFSFFWNFKLFGLLVSSFLLLMILTQSNFWLSLTGSLWLFFSSFVQWWFSTFFTEMLVLCFGAVVAFLYLLTSRDIRSIVAAGLCFFVFSTSFVLCLYPPFQVPVAYLAIFLVAGFLLQNRGDLRRVQQLATRSIVFTFFLCVTVLFLFFYYSEAKETIALVTQTEYPGQRTSAGGEIGISRYFSEFFGVFLQDGIHPPQWENVSEASNFILLFPLVFAIIARSMAKRTDLHGLEVSLLTYILFLSAWMLIDLPELIGKITLLDRVPSIRGFAGIGPASIILTMVFLANRRPIHAHSGAEETSEIRGEPLEHGSQRRKRPLRLIFRTQSLSLGFGLLAISFLFGLYANDGVSGYYKGWQVFVASVLFASLAYFLVARNAAFFCIGILLVTIPRNFNVNPLSVGLAPIYEKKLAAVAVQIRKQEPNARWVSMGTFEESNFLKAVGVNIVNGTKYAPDLELMKSFDPDQRNVRFYNRYANIQIFPADNLREGEQPVYRLNNVDSYTIYTQPCAAGLKGMSIDYFVFAYLPRKEDLSCIAPLFDEPVSKLWVYKRRQEPLPMKLAGLDQRGESTASMISSIRLEAERHVIVIQGWAVDSIARAPAAGVFVDFEGLLFAATTGLERVDVANTYGLPQYRHSGFQAVVPIARVGRGQHEIRLKVVSADGKAYNAPPRIWLVKF